MLGVDELPDADGVLPELELEPLAGGVLEPLAAPLDGAEELVEGVLAEPLALDEPPEAESFFVASADEEELEDDGELGGVAPALLEDEGELGVVLTEPDAELEPDGVEAEPDDGVVVEPLEEEDDAPGLDLSPALSPQAVSMLAPKTIDTATAKVESLMLWASLVGVSLQKQGARLTR